LARGGGAGTEGEGLASSGQSRKITPAASREEGQQEEAISRLVREEGRGEARSIGMASNKWRRAFNNTEYAMGEGHGQRLENVNVYSKVLSA
jgi:hypothetical protein